MKATILGKIVEYKDKYDPSALHAISRQIGRDEINVNSDNLPFTGVDIWNGYEVSWLSESGKPEVRIIEFTFDCQSPNLVESKSFKLYLNSFNNTKFKTDAEVKQLMEYDLSTISGSKVKVQIYNLDNIEKFQIYKPYGKCLDDINIITDIYHPDKNLLQLEQVEAKEELYTNLLKSNCLVTGQPDWATLLISYEGQKINHASLLKYVISFRNHNEFHEQCVERIFKDITEICAPKYLKVEARYTRRGGLDINPIRTNEVGASFENKRLVRQ